MGRIREYRCKECNYKYEGTAGPDCGMEAFVINTYNCNSCHRTFDYYTSFDEFCAGDFVIECNHCKSKDIKVWNRDCPKCSGEMADTEKIEILWE